MASEEPSGSGSSIADAPAPAPVAAPATAEAPASETTPASTDDKASSGPAEAKAPAKKTKAKTTKAKAKVKAKAPESVHPDDDPSLWIYTSLTAGNMHIVTATSRLETILRANRVPFKAVDIAVDSRARILWGKRAGKAADGRQRRLPGLVQMGQVLGDIVEIEEWNEYGELKQHVKIYFDEFTQPPKGSIAPVPKYRQPEDKLPHPPAALNPPPAPEREKSAAEEHANKLAQAVRDAGAGQVGRGVAEEAAQRGKQIEQQAKQARLQALKEKAQRAKREADGEKEEAGSGSGSAEPPTAEMAQLSVATEPTPPSGAGEGARAGLQSPTSGAWKDSGSGTSMGEALRAVQSPTTSSWVPPAESSLARGEDTFAGARVASASAAEIAEVESKAMIKEEPEEEEEEEAVADGEVEAKA